MRLSTERLLVVVEDDVKFARTFGRSFERRGYQVAITHSPAELEQVLQSSRPGFAVVDLKLGTQSGLTCVRRLHEFDPDMLIVVLTGYASIATAVEAIKLGACHYLPKPANADDVDAAFSKAATSKGGGDEAVPIGTRPTSLKTLEWERINEMLADTGFNISEAARRLGMHRRTLARKLEKRQIT